MSVAQDQEPTSDREATSPPLALAACPCRTDARAHPVKEKLGSGPVGVGIGGDEDVYYDHVAGRVLEVVTDATEVPDHAEKSAKKASKK